MNPQAEPSGDFQHLQQRFTIHTNLDEVAVPLQLPSVVIPKAIAMAGNIISKGCKCLGVQAKVNHGAMLMRYI